LWKERVKIREEINEMKSKTTIQKIDETMSWLIEKKNKIDKPLAKLTKSEMKERESFKLIK
jgi:hypothetical protein